MSLYFYPNGDKIKTQEEFIRFYKQVYYYRNRDRELEQDIGTILENDTLTRENVVDILRWKVGTTKYDYKGETVQTRRGNINVGALLECLGVGRTEDKFKKERLLLEGSWEKTFDLLIGQDGIGPVYAITLLYFLTNGQCPIYDKFAHMAVKAIRKCKDEDGDMEFDRLVTEKELQEGVPVETWGKYRTDYVEQIKGIFGAKYKKTRDIDRALWAYGHLFNKTQSNSEGEK